MVNYDHAQINIGKINIMAPGYKFDSNITASGLRTSPFASSLRAM